MRDRSKAARDGIGICAILIMLASCTGPQSQTNALVPNQNSSWMARDAKAKALVYVANSKGGSVDAYSFPDGKPEGRLLGIDANALCATARGDVYFAKDDEIVEYAHGGLRPIAELQNPLGGAIASCDVDPETGSLAVAGGSGAGSGVAIYAQGKTSANVYRAPNLGGFGSAAFDGKGDLFVETSRDRQSQQATTLVELPKGGKRFRNVAWNGPPPRFGSIQWDGRYLAVENPPSRSIPPTIVRFAPGVRQATFVSKSTLENAGDATRFTIAGREIIVLKPLSIAFYGYPKGGTPLKTIDDALKPGAAAFSPASESKFAVVTYHYDTLRTGWNADESTLTQKSLKNGSFGLLQTVALDDQVDAQPLLVPDETIGAGEYSGSEHDVVYVVTESNTIYAIDATSGTILLSQNLGTPVPMPLGCNNNGPNVGTTATPVIDQAANVMYVIAYSLVGSVPTYTIHELNLSTLTDAVTPVVVSASHKLTNGHTYKFAAAYQRQRPALLEANGNVYAGFGSFCDYYGSQSRGWLLGWQAGTLTPLSANRLVDSRATSRKRDFFLSSIWMSGDGIAADATGDLYFVTGNSQPKTYNGDTDIQESVVKVSADLTDLLGIFTPANATRLDDEDGDFGSGGVLLLPTTGSGPALATAAGKNGTLFLLNQNDLGGYHRKGDHVLSKASIGGCWCGESYFAAASSGGGRVVASGGNSLTLWNVEGSSKATLVSAGSVNYLPGGQDPGFFTSVSSNGEGLGAIIWAVTRPQYASGPISLYAFTSKATGGSSTLQTLYEGTAGSWASSNGDANLVPVVANGKVYVASYEQLDIFGLGASGTKRPLTRGFAGGGVIGGAAHQVTGTLMTIGGSLLTLRTRTQQIVRVDDSDAVRRERSSELVLGQPFEAGGRYDAAGVLHAAIIVRAKPLPVAWPPDR
ncbi:MAG TPA: hypothetical protein VGX91_13510 [Candidatus Cybelea sp.]|nr:hypothetical protein [Candidatus Cybelea sp.]